MTRAEGHLLFTRKGYLAPFRVKVFKEFGKNGNLSGSGTVSALRVDAAYEP